MTNAFGLFQTFSSLSHVCQGGKSIEKPCLVMALTIAAMAGCIGNDPEADELSQSLADFEGCNITYPTGEPDPCEDTVMRIEGTPGVPPPPWVCMYDDLYWNPVSEDYAVHLDIDSEITPEFSWISAWDREEEKTWLVEFSDHEFWLPIGKWAEWPGNIGYSYFISELVISTNSTILENATTEMLWSHRVDGDQNGPIRQLAVRFHTDETYYTFSANSWHPLIPGHWSAGPTYVEFDNQYLSMRVPHIDSHSFGPASPTPLQCSPGPLDESNLGTPVIHPPREDREEYA